MRNIASLASDKPRKHRPMYQILVYVGLLLLLGMVVMYSIGPQYANAKNQASGSNFSDTYFFFKQLVSVSLATTSFFACFFIPYEWFTEKLPRKIFLIGLISSFLLVVAGAVLHLSIAEEVNGAYRWFRLGALGSFQPSELLKFGALVFVSGFLGRRASQGKLNDIQETLVPIGIAIVTALGVVVVLQKDLGTGISLIAIVLSILVASGMKWSIIGKITAALVIGAVLLTISSPHRMERVTTFLKADAHKSQSADSDDYHIRQAYIAVGSGGLFGLGIGKSIQSTGYLPEAINDSIFAVMGEVFGFVGLVVILGIFTALLLSLLRVAARLADMRLRLVAAGVFGWVGAQVVMNIAAMTGVFPLTGIPLPLLSYGGTSMLFIAAALGLVFQLSAYTSHKPLTEGADNGKNPRSRRRVGRTRHASRGSL